MSGLLRTVILSSALLVTPIAAAAPWRIDFVARHDGHRIAGAEVCFFRPGDGADPFDHFLRTDDIRCTSADAVIEIPVGRWLVYARHRSGLISINPSQITNPEPGPPKDVFETVSVDMVPAGVVDFTRITPALTPDDWLALYLPNAGTEWVPMFIPVPRSATTALIPADQSVLLLQMRGGSIRAVSNPITVSKSESVTAEPFPPVAEGRRTIITWVEFPDDARKPADYWRNMKAPTAVLVDASGEPHAPLLPLRPGFGADGALLIFRNVPLAAQTVRVTGDTWIRDELPVEATASGTMRTTHGLTIRPAAALTVTWSVDHPAAPPAPDDCAGDTKQHASEPDIAVRLFACEGLRPETPVEEVEGSRCRAAATPVLDETHRTARFTGVRPGTWLLVVRAHSFAVQRKVVTLGVGDDAAEGIAIRGFNVFGRVTIDGKPVHARVEFRTGSAVTDFGGDYYAALAQSPRSLPIRVIRCEDQHLLFTKLPFSPLADNERYDIEIPTNHVDIRVVDEQNRGIAGASVHMGAFMERNSDAGEFVGEIPDTDADGATSVDHVPSDRELTVCAVHRDYPRACTDRFSMGDRTTQSVTLTLQHKASRRGQVVSQQPLTWGRIYFVRADGAVIEWGPIAADGSFTYRQDHHAPEYVVIVSSMPLLVMPVPEASDEVLSIRFPSAPVMDIEVEIGPTNTQQDARIGLKIGPWYVPELAWSMHQSARGLQPFLYHKGPLHIPSIFATASPLTVILGPSPYAPPPGLGEGVDVFTLPAYASQFPVKTVQAGAKTVF